MTGDRNGIPAAFYGNRPSPQPLTPHQAVRTEQIKREREQIVVNQEREKGWLRPLS